MDEPGVNLAPADLVVIINQLGVVGVAGEGIDNVDVGVDLESVTEDVDLLGTISNASTEGPLSAVPDEEDGGLRILDIVAEVVEDPASLTHS